MANLGLIADAMRQDRDALLERWLEDLRASGVAREDLISAKELKEQANELLNLAVASLGDVGGQWEGEGWNQTRDFLRRISVQRARQAVPPTDTALFVLSLKQHLVDLLGDSGKGGAKEKVEAIAAANRLFDRMALFTVEVHQRTREETIVRQQQELLELSTPVVKLWDRILALPLIGTLDSRRTQVVMEALLQDIVDTGAEIAILDITGVPTVDTLVAQHLMKTVAAARLMGAECIISGIRPQIAQTVVHLGVDLKDIVTKATLADAFAEALYRTGAEVRTRKE